MAELSPIIFGAMNISPASIIFSLKAVEISPLPPSKRTESISNFPNSFNISFILNIFSSRKTNLVPRFLYSLIFSSSLLSLDVTIIDFPSLKFKNLASIGLSKFGSITTLKGFLFSIPYFSTSNLESPIEAKFLNFNDNKAIIVTSSDNRELEKIEEYKNLGTRFIFLEGKIFKMKDILKELGKLEIDSVLLEGESGLISTAFKENIIDAGEIFIAPKIIGDNSAIPFINGFNFDNMEEVFKLPNPKFNIYGDNISIEFENL